MLNGKITIIFLIVGSIENTLCKWGNFFLNQNVFRKMWKLNLIYLIIWFNYLFNFLLKGLILASLKWEMNKFYFGKLETTPVGLSKLTDGDVVNNEVV